MTRFRREVLTRDPVCVWPDCHDPATVADHYPLTRRQLITAGLDPNDPTYGRGLCAHHHNVHTGYSSPSNPATT